jgi:hypothetical protein
VRPTPAALLIGSYMQNQQPGGPIRAGVGQRQQASQRTWSWLATCGSKQLGSDCRKRGGPNRLVEKEKKEPPFPLNHQVRIRIDVKLAQILMSVRTSYYHCRLTNFLYIYRSRPTPNSLSASVESPLGPPFGVLPPVF